MDTTQAPALAGTGVPGLDDVLGGGLTPHRLYLLEGIPGSGKTTLAFQFLLEGVRCGETVLYVTLSETEEEIRAVAASHGWPLDGVRIYELGPDETILEPDAQYTVFHPSEVELGDTTQRILEHVGAVKPSRVVFDSLSELRLLAGNALRYRRQILALKQYFAGRRCTVLMLDDLTGADHDLQVRSIAHGAILLEHAVPAYGKLRRRLQVVKYRGVRFRSGHHDYEIVRGGLVVFPRLVAAEHRQEGTHERVNSGVRELDQLLGGGLERGTSTLLTGAAGTGKSTLAASFATAAAKRGERAAFFIFDESTNTLLTRTDGMGIDMRSAVDAGRISVRQIDPAELSPGELSHAIRDAVEQDDARIVVIDSLNGYLNSMPEERFLTIQLHEVLTYLGQRGVATLLISAHQGLLGPMNSPVDASYLADAIVLLRYYEAEGEVRQAISVVKKRGGQHERTIRDFRLTSDGVRVGEPLRDYRGVLTGVPERVRRS
jgi:circadian clock protein KaiC